MRTIVNHSNVDDTANLIIACKTYITDNMCCKVLAGMTDDEELYAAVTLNGTEHTTYNERDVEAWLKVLTYDDFGALASLLAENGY